MKRMILVMLACALALGGAASAMAGEASVEGIVRAWIEAYRDTPAIDLTLLDDADAAKKLDMGVAMGIAGVYIMAHHEVTLDELGGSVPQVIYWDIEDCWLVNIVPAAGEAVYTVKVNAETGLVIEASFGEGQG